MAPRFDTPNPHVAPSFSPRTHISPADIHIQYDTQAIISQLTGGADKNIGSVAPKEFDAATKAFSAKGSSDPQLATVSALVEALRAGNRGADLTTLDILETLKSNPNLVKETLRRIALGTPEEASLGAPKLIPPTSPSGVKPAERANALPSSDLNIYAQQLGYTKDLGSLEPTAKEALSKIRGAETEMFSDGYARSHLQFLKSLGHNQKEVAQTLGLITGSEDAALLEELAQSIMGTRAALSPKLEPTVAPPPAPINPHSGPFNWGARLPSPPKPANLTVEPRFASTLHYDYANLDSPTLKSAIDKLASLHQNSSLAPIATGSFDDMLRALKIDSSSLNPKDRNLLEVLHRRVDEFVRYPSFAKP